MNNIGHTKNTFLLFSFKCWNLHYVHCLIFITILCYVMSTPQMSQIGSTWGYSQVSSTTVLGILIHFMRLVCVDCLLKNIHTRTVAFFSRLSLLRCLSVVLVLSYGYSIQPILLGLTQEWIGEFSFSRLECGVHDRLHIYHLYGMFYFWNLL